jgi:hypothetical protein
MTLKILGTSMPDYSIFYKSHFPFASTWQNFDVYDVFISAYTSSERVQQVYGKVAAACKHWIVFKEYGYENRQLPSSNTFVAESRIESDIIPDFWSTLPTGSESKSICIDITGFIRPHLLFLLKWLQQQGVTRFDALYSEPVKYIKREQTLFSDEIIEEIRQVSGFEGIHSPNFSNDLLVIGAGYENHLISQVAKHKDLTKKALLFGFPSLRADMFQENVLKAHLAEEDIGTGAFEDRRRYFAPANDPFVTANVLHDIVENFGRRAEVTNLYLCPISTKAQTLGFCIFFLYECLNRPASIVFPFSPTYARETTTGVSRVWKYSVELPPCARE